jgi:hypothetical protein
LTNTFTLVGVHRNWFMLMMTTATKFGFTKGFNSGQQETWGKVC